MMIKYQDRTVLNKPIMPYMILDWAHIPAPGRWWIFSILLCKSTGTTAILVIRFVGKQFYVVGRIKSRTNILPCKIELSGKDMFYLMEKVF